MRNVFPCESYPYDWKVNYGLRIIGILSNKADDSEEHGVIRASTGIYETNALSSQAL